MILNLISNTQTSFRFFIGIFSSAYLLTIANCSNFDKKYKFCLNFQLHKVFIKRVYLTKIVANMFPVYVCRIFSSLTMPFYTLESSCTTQGRTYTNLIIKSCNKIHRAFFICHIQKYQKVSAMIKSDHHGRPLSTRYVYMSVFKSYKHFF